MKTRVTIEQYKQSILDFRQQAEAASHRRLVVLSGDQRQMVELAMLAIAELNVQTIRWLSDNAPAEELPYGFDVLTAKSAMRYLGSESELIVLDGFAGLHPDGLGAISGTLKAGGLFFLLIPSMHDWVAYDDPDYERITSQPYKRESLHRYFIQRIKSTIASSSDILLVEQGGQNELSISQPLMTRVIAESRAITLSDGCLTEGQLQGVQAICNVVSGHRRRPLVLTSDRGRGKSATLGLAAVKLLKQKNRRIIITAPYPEAVESAFARLLASFEKGERHGQVFYCEPGSPGNVEFIAPDELIETSPDADLVMVDEAAAIPVPMLASLLARYSRIVFSSTIHGYEGTGRGFAVRFTKLLDIHTPQWRALHLTAPIRWADNDPLEQFVFDALLLNASPSEPDLPTEVAPASTEVRWLNREALANDREQLNEVFGLLVLAHYRTSPDDLRILLDGPSIRIAALYNQSTLLAVALVCREGGLDRTLGDLIWQGRRRPRGHLIPQALSTYGGEKIATDLVADRIMRIAVHPRLQHSGWGTQLVQAIVDKGRKEFVDYVGASFGATADLLRFWSHSGFTMVRLGVHKEASSGARSAIVVMPVSESGQALCDRSEQRFLEQFVFDLNDTFAHLDFALVTQVLGGSKAIRPSFNEQARSDLLAFTQHLRIYESCSASVWALVMTVLQRRLLVDQEDSLDTEVLVRRVVQKWPSSKIIKKYRLTGKKELNKSLVRACRSLLAKVDGG